MPFSSRDFGDYGAQDYRPNVNAYGYNNGGGGSGLGGGTVQHRQFPSSRLPPLPKDNILHASGAESRQGNDYATQHQMSETMKPYLHLGFGDTIIFKAWILRSQWDVILTCLAFLLLALLYEGLKCYREHLYKRLSFAVQRQVPVLAGHRNSQAQGQHLDKENHSSHGGGGVTLNNGNGLIGSTVNLRMFSWPHFVQSMLHVCQLVLSYALMLGVMTLNIALIASVLVGSGIGYFLFSWRKVTVVHVAEHCQ